MLHGSHQKKISVNLLRFSGRTTALRLIEIELSPTRGPERPYFPDAASPLVAHECIVSVDLAGKSRPAGCEISQNVGLCFALGRFHQATALCRLILAMPWAIHEMTPQLIPRTVAPGALAPRNSNGSQTRRPS
jgi:hypothetical protein